MKYSEGERAKEIKSNSKLSVSELSETKVGGKKSYYFDVDNGGDIVKKVYFIQNGSIIIKSIQNYMGDASSLSMYREEADKIMSTIKISALSINISPTPSTTATASSKPK